MLPTLPLLEQTDFPPIRRRCLDTVQVNLGYRCNQQCLHCHVNAGPHRREMMASDTVEQVLDFLQRAGAAMLDLTGGAPELHPRFRDIVSRARELGMHVIDRCNLTILEERDQAGLAEFLAEQGVEVIASLPCYLEDNVNTQRGDGVFSASIRGLQRLNALGYGRQADRALNLVFNPQGPVLPPPQQQLQADYTRELGERYGIVFNRLFTLTNMPIQRFGSALISRGQFADYMRLLHQAYKPENLDHLMCRSLISIDWRGQVYDCDFNQLLGLEIPSDNLAPMHIATLEPEDVATRAIVVRDHCYGCTAGQGSSCGGALS